jgi:transposase InsO family protein
MCQLAEVSRAGYYRRWQEQAPEEEAMAVRAAIQQIVLEHRRRYGYRRVTAELRRRGMVVNHKRVVRLMQEDQLLALRRRPWIATTDSGHELPVYVNLARRMQLSAPDQLWVADITSIRLAREFVYLAVVIDGFSRRAVGWALERSLQTRLTVAALQRAVAQRRPAPGLVHHSDRGTQYAAAEYASLLAQHSITASMSRPAYPYDNAQCESFIKTLKQEEIYCHGYRDLEDLRAHLQEFIAEYYNRCRLHSALGYQSPAEFEAACQGEASTTSLAASVTLSFPGMGKSISPMDENSVADGRSLTTGKAGGSQAPRPIGSMSLQPTIPRRVALQQSSLPLHQPGASLAETVSRSEDKNIER